MKKIKPEYGQRIIIADYYDSDIRLAEAFPAPTFIKLRQSDMEHDLIAEFIRRKYDTNTTLIVFVGQSSMELKQRLDSRTSMFNNYAFTFVHAERKQVENGSGYKNMEATVGRMLEYAPYDLSVKNIIVFDDVISSGSTIKKLRERNYQSFPNAIWSVFCLVSRTEKMKGYAEIYSSFVIEDRYVPINTLSKLVENKIIREEYVSRYGVSRTLRYEMARWLEWLEQCCIYTPHVFCFDLYNTLVTESKASYLGYLSKNYSIDQNELYDFVRDNIMNKGFESFAEMIWVIYQKFMPDEICVVEDKKSSAGIAEEYWRTGSNSVEWKERKFPRQLEILRKQGHKIILVTNCTLPAWRILTKDGGVLANKNKLFDECFVSSIEGVSKPCEDVWKKIEKKFYSFPRSKFVMIGDSPTDDLAIPEKRGWQTMPAYRLNLADPNAGMVFSFPPVLSGKYDDEDAVGILFH